MFLFSYAGVAGSLLPRLTCVLHFVLPQSALPVDNNNTRSLQTRAERIASKHGSVLARNKKRDN
jgi:hypothetical protein